MSGKAFKVVKSPLHGRGVIATRPIEIGEHIVEYVGERISKAESYRRGVIQQERADKTGCGAVYTFSLNNRYDVDGKRGNNPARYINHSCDPNCMAYNERGRIWIAAIKDIQAGEELTYNYGFEFDNDAYTQHPCRCGSIRCVGYILAECQWYRLRRALLRKGIYNEFTSTPIKQWRARTNQ